MQCIAMLVKTMKVKTYIIKCTYIYYFILNLADNILRYNITLMVDYTT